MHGMSLSQKSYQFGGIYGRIWTCGAGILLGCMKKARIPLELARSVCILMDEFLSTSFTQRTETQVKKIGDIVSPSQAEFSAISFGLEVARNNYFLSILVEMKKIGDIVSPSQAEFSAISFGLEVLSDPKKRAVYNQYGEEGLKGAAPPPESGGASFFSTGEGPTTFRFNPRDADDIFAKFFESSSPFGGGGGGSSMRGTRFSSSIFGDDIFGSFGEGMGGGGGGSMHQSAPRKAPPIENRLPCSLEALYKGTTKKMKISRVIADMSGKTMQVEEILTINVKPGWKKDLIFIINEKPHGVFTRDGNDLIVTQKISLAEALTGYTVHLTTLDGGNLTIPINNVIHPNYEEVVLREGMPIQKDPTKRGNLRIKFNIKFPTRLTTGQKSGSQQG
ncbi:hypothetical protein CRYUN_Cryun04dG0113100 [Craigia yunnanensis]